MTKGSVATITLFRELSASAISDIQERCHWQRLATGDLVFDRENDTLDVYFVVQGSVRILNVGADGREVALADIPPGNYFGEMAAIDGLHRSARVIALEESLLASLDGPAFLDLMRIYPVIALKVVERLTRMVRDLDNRVTQISTQSENQRIWAQLLRLARPDPAKVDGWLIEDMPNHKEIAAWSGTTREQVAQAIGDLARDGIVRRRSMGLLIQDLSQLQMLVGKT